MTTCLLPPLQRRHDHDVKDINEPPVIDSQSFSIDENSAAGTLVVTLTAHDPMREPAGQFSWSIIGGNTASAFQLVPSPVR